MNLIPDYCSNAVLDLTMDYGAPVADETEIVPEGPNNMASAAFTFPIDGTPWVLSASFDESFVSLSLMCEEMRHEIVSGGDLDDWRYWQRAALRKARALQALNKQ